MEPAPTTASTSQEATVSATAALAFLQLSAGFQHTCGVTTDFRAYCWGQNGNGQTGIGTFDNCDFGCPVFYPTPVKGGLSFKQVDAGTNHTCGVTPANRAYCWGYGRLLGTGTTTSRPTPTAVAGARSFRQVSAGGDHSCGVTADDRAYCWGENARGQLGDGTLSQRRWPKAVAGGLSFNRVTAGGFHTCALTPSNKTYCWGRGGAVGDGTNVDRPKPVAVAGGFSFNQVSAGGAHTCAKTGASAGYCWGSNDWNQLGDGMVIDSYTPSPVTGPAATVALR
jgi:alpha-tubulin suppressor-like RCC1 family protein